MYSTKTLQILENPKNIGIIKCASGVGEAGKGDFSDLIKIYINVEDGIITDAKFKAYGDVMTIVTGSVITQLIIRKNIDFAKSINVESIINYLGSVPETDIEKIKLGIEALSKSIYMALNPDENM